MISLYFCTYHSRRSQKHLVQGGHSIKMIIIFERKRIENGPNAQCFLSSPSRRYYRSTRGRLILGLLHGVAVVYIVPSHNQINTRAFEQTSWEDVPPSPISGNEWKKWIHEWSITLWQASLLIIARKRWRVVREVLREGFSGGSVVKNLPAKTGDAGDASSIPRLGRNPEGGNGNPLQYSCRENPMDRGAAQAIVHGVAKNWTQLGACTRIPSAHPSWGRSQAHRAVASAPSRKWKWGQWIVSLCHEGKGFKCLASLSTPLMATTLQRLRHLSSRWPLPVKLEGLSNIRPSGESWMTAKKVGDQKFPWRVLVIVLSVCSDTIRAVRFSI